MEKIDFVVTWVDDSDPAWQAEKAKYSPKSALSSSVDNRKERYRDMGTLPYFFRGIDKFAPWVNKVYFVTCGQKPDWLNENCEKLVLVNHSDYIPAECLPTFNSNAIEANLHEIKGLSEKFVYFNDDIFLVNPTTPEDFFKNGLPCDTFALRALAITGKSEEGFFKKLANDIFVINKHFSFKEFLKNNWRKVLSFKQGKYWFMTVPMLLYGYFTGFHCAHLPYSYLKSTFEKVWEAEPEILRRTQSFRFRNNRDSVNHYLCQYWQYASGQFEQRSVNFGRMIYISDKKAEQYILGRKYKALCIEDEYDIDNYEECRKRVLAALDKKLPDKCQFEK